ncbi:MAG: glycosyltransferase family 2 protein [Elusimicrobiota bacterium]|jgi:glycosyltransferase involved in cell wall biosynthesis
MSTQLVSVIIPTFNRAYCLRRAIDSILNQTHRNVEVIVVDDGSTDETRELMRSAYAQEPRVRYVYQENAGVSAARNHGLSLARGEFISLLDSDDEWYPWKLSVQLACLNFLPGVGMI